MVFSEKIDSLIKHYESLGPQFDLAFATAKGTYFPASIYNLANTFEKLIKKHIINKNQKFLDAGSGDGRIVALASLMGLEAYGIEYNKYIFQSSVEYIYELYKDKILFNRPTLINGDFLDDKVYAKTDVEFKDFDVIFNFNTQPYQLVCKICLESPQKAVFIFNSIRQVLEPNDCLKLIKKDYFQEIHQLLHTYEKV